MAKQSQASRVSRLELSNHKALATRKETVADATWRVVAAIGFEGATLRAIADEAGCTTGVLMHYFRDKEELFLFSLDRMFERVDTEFAEAPRQKNSIEALKKALVGTFPIQEQSELEGRIWLNFVGRALWNAAFLQEHRRRYARFRLLVEKTLRVASEAGDIECLDSFDKEADTILALLDGIIIHALLEPDRFPASRLRAILDLHFSRLAKPKSLNGK